MNTRPAPLKTLAVITICATIPILALWFTIGLWLKEGFGGFRGLYFSIEFAVIAGAAFAFYKRGAATLLAAVIGSAYLASVITYAAINRYLGKDFTSLLSHGYLWMALFLLPFHLPFALAGTVTGALVLVTRPGLPAPLPSTIANPEVKLPWRPPRY